MPIKVPACIYRNRHGTFYARILIPSPLRATAGRTEVRFSLQTEQRKAALTAALQLAIAKQALFRDLQHMADEDQKAPAHFWLAWISETRKNAQLTERINELEGEVAALQLQLNTSVPRLIAQNVVEKAFIKGQLRGKTELETALVFPWPAEKTPLFSELLAAYLRSLSQRAIGGRKKPPGKKTLESYRKDIEQFTFIMNDIRIGTIDRDMAGCFFGLLRRLPANASRVKAYRDKTADELLAMDPPPQSEQNASKKAERISAMFRWALEEKRKWGIDANPFSGFGQAETLASSRRPFTTDELRALLNHKDFQSKRFRKSYAFWLLPLAIFTGARLGELAQLDLADFTTVDGIPCIDINDREAIETVTDEQGRKKSVKNANAKRLVPLHPELIRIGLLRYVEAMRKQGRAHLFPELSRTRRDGPAHAASNWFQRFRHKAGIEGKQEAVFHSFRHLFITRLLDEGIAPHLVAPIVGHEAELVTGKVYWNTRDASKRRPTVEAFSLPDEIVSMIPSVEDVTWPEKKRHLA